MFLISKFVYEAMAKSKTHNETSPYLKIHKHSAENHSQTFYKFSYGAPYDTTKEDKVGTPVPLNLKPGAYTSIWSLEGFEFSERVVAIFGHPSELFKRGLELIHSPFIEPAFRGQLQLVIKNFSNQNVTLNPGEIIGKIVFFDISDTIVSAEDLLTEVRDNAANQIRENALKALSNEFYGKKG